MGRLIPLSSGVLPARLGCASIRSSPSLHFRAQLPPLLCLLCLALPGATSLICNREAGTSDAAGWLTHRDEHTPIMQGGCSPSPAQNSALHFKGRMCAIISSAKRSCGYTVQ